MNKKIFMLIATMLLLTASAVAQDPELARKVQEHVEKQKREHAAIDAILNISPAAKAVREKLNAGLGDAIREASKTGDKSLIPHLKVLATDNEDHIRGREGSLAFEAHLSLAKLGDEDAISEIFAEVDSESLTLQDGAIAKLARLGSKRAYRKLYELLDDMTERDKVDNDVMDVPKSLAVIQQLIQTVENPPRNSKGNIPLLDTAAWKAWFQKNKHLIE